MCCERRLSLHVCTMLFHIEKLHGNHLLLKTTIIILSLTSKYNDAHNVTCINNAYLIKLRQKVFTESQDKLTR
jgi:hypothetical protein